MKFNPIGGSPDDFLQPGDPRFKKVYGHDPLEETKKRKRQARKESDDRKNKLEEKYWKMKKDGRIKPWQERDLKRIVINEDKTC